MSKFLILLSFLTILLLGMIFLSGNSERTLKDLDYTTVQTIRGTLMPSFGNYLRIRYKPNVPLDPFTAPLKKNVYTGKYLPFLLYSPKYLVAVRDQGNCGSCYAFAITDMIADRLSIYTHGNQKELLSVQQLISCQNDDGCGGESPEDVLQWMDETNFLLTQANNMLYKQRENTTVVTRCSYFNEGVKIRDVRRLTEFIREDNPNQKKLKTNIENMKNELLNHGPFYCAMTVYDSLYEYDGTKPYRKKKGEKSIGGHALEIIGYCDKQEDHRDGYDNGYWIVRNSWSNNFPQGSPDSGYFTVAMGTNECGIESRCGSAEPDIDVEGINKSDMRFESFEEFYSRRRGRYT